MESTLVGAKDAMDVEWISGDLSYWRSDVRSDRFQFMLQASWLRGRPPLNRPIVLSTPDGSIRRGIEDSILEQVEPSRFHLRDTWRDGSTSASRYRDPTSSISRPISRGPRACPLIPCPSLAPCRAYGDISHISRGEVARGSSPQSQVGTTKSSVEIT